MQLIQDLDIKPGTRVLLRCDLNLPQDEQGGFKDFFRLESSLPTINYLLNKDATIFICSHLGSPKGKPNPKLSLQPLAEIIADQLGQKVDFIQDPFNPTLNLRDKEGVLLIENLRFWPGEESDSFQFAQDLIHFTGAELFIQDAFGVSHRNHASLTKFPEILPCAAGLLLQKEIQFLNLPATSNLNLLIGGAKVESKLPVVANFIDRADSILAGGVVANTLLKASKLEIGASLFEAEVLPTAIEIITKLKDSKTTLLLPTDYLTAPNPEALLAQEFNQENLRQDQMILDLGVSTTLLYKSKLQTASTIVWAGTLGFAENPVFASSSRDILNYLLDLKIRDSKLRIIIGGGDTVDFVRSQLDQAELNLIDHLSTGGGASLLMLSGQSLPGITALDKVSHSFEPTNSNNPSSNHLELKSSSSIAHQDKKRPILIANLKSHFSLEQTKAWLQEFLSSSTLTSANLGSYIAAPALFLEELTTTLGQANLSNKPAVIAQDVSAFEEGAQTGEIAASMLDSIASGTLIGHSERRNIFHEDESTISKKINQALQAGLTITLCVGGNSKEILSQKKEVSDQLNSALSNFSPKDLSFLQIAYEPVFAIGSGDVPTDEFLADQLKAIRKILSSFGNNVPILYGGSVSPDNAKQIINLGFDGLLVGSASLKIPLLEEIGINMLG